MNGIEWTLAKGVSDVLEHLSEKYILSEKFLIISKEFQRMIEWTPYPVLVIKEFQRRFKPEFLDKLVESVDDAKKKGQKIGKLAKIRGIKLSQRVKSRAKKNSLKKDCKGEATYG